MNNGYFICGTGTDVGKTYISALLVADFHKKNASTGYYKAMMSGDQDGMSDADYVQEISNVRKEWIQVSYAFKTPVSPHLACTIEKVDVNWETIKKDFNAMREKCETVIVEGSGGIVCPLFEKDKLYLLEDVVRLTNYPLIIVCDSGLGSINAAVLTAHYATSKKLEVCGFIMNRFDKNNTQHLDNRRMIEKITNIPVIGYVEEKGTQIIYL